MEKADDDDDLIGKHMTVHIKWPLLMFAADTPKDLQENNNLRVSVQCLLSKSIIDAKICLMQFRDLIGATFDTIEADLDGTILLCKTIACDQYTRNDFMTDHVV